MNHWFFQRSAERFTWRSHEEVDRALLEAESSNRKFARLSGVTENWTAKKFFKEMQPGDIAFFWLAGADGGIEGWGRISGTAEETRNGRRIRVTPEILLTRIIHDGV